jgi:iron complex outermembrane receptor protein
MTKETVISRSLRLAFSGAVAFGSIAAQAQTSDAPMQRVEITGSSIKRAQAEGALPVQTVTRDDIAKMGVTNTEALLQQVTAISAVGGVPSAAGVGSSTYGEATVSLRGIGSSKTLILVNGRRLANYATDGTAVDINVIPLAAVDHVEVLKDGASGVYGSDAIGGVINFILRNNFNGVEATAYASGTKDGGGLTKKASVIAGWGDFDEDRYNITVAADVSKDTTIYGSQAQLRQEQLEQQRPARAKRDPERRHHQLHPEHHSEPVRRDPEHAGSAGQAWAIRWHRITAPPTAANTTPTWAPAASTRRHTWAWYRKPSAPTCRLRSASSSTRTMNCSWKASTRSRRPTTTRSLRPTAIPSCRPTALSLPPMCTRRSS